VSSIDPAATQVELVNLSAADDRELILQGGAFAENQIETVSYDSFEGSWTGSFYDYIGTDFDSKTATASVESAYLAIALPAGTRVTLTLRLRLHANRQTYLAPWDVDETIASVRD
jgi:hypothetical protein